MNFVILRRFGPRGAQVALHPDELAWLGWKPGEKVARLVERGPDGRGRIILEKAPPVKPDGDGQGEK